MKLRILKNVIILALVVFAVSTWGDIVSIYGIKPDIVLIIIVWMALHQGSMTAQISGFASGIVEDVLSLSPLGFHAASRTIIGFAIGSIRDYVGVDRVIIPVLFTAASYILQSVWFLLAALVFDLAVSYNPVFSFEFLGGLLYSIILAPIVFLIADMISSFIKPASGRFT